MNKEVSSGNEHRQIELREVKHPNLHPRLSWQNWTKKNLPNSFIIGDIDNVIRSRDGKIMILEIKSMGAEWMPAQSVTMQFLNHLARRGNGREFPIKIKSKIVKMSFQYMGMALISFRGKEGDFSKGVTFNNVEITEQELIKLLSFKITFNDFLKGKSKRKLRR